MNVKKEPVKRNIKELNLMVKKTKPIEQVAIETPPLVSETPPLIFETINSVSLIKKVKKPPAKKNVKVIIKPPEVNLSDMTKDELLNALKELKKQSTAHTKRRNKILKTLQNLPTLTPVSTKICFN